MTILRHADRPCDMIYNKVYEVYYVRVPGVLCACNTHAAACRKTTEYRAFSKRRPFALQKDTF